MLQARDFNKYRDDNSNSQPHGTKLRYWKASAQQNHGSHATDVEKATQGHKKKDSITTNVFLFVTNTPDYSNKIFKIKST